MKTRNFLEKKRSGVILRSLLALCIFTIVAGCKKDPIDLPQPPPSDSLILKLSLNGVQVLNTYSLEIGNGDKVCLVWEYTGKTPFQILMNGQHFSERLKGDTSVTVSESLIFRFTVQGNLLSQQINVSLKIENVLPTITSFTSSKDTIAVGDSVVLTLRYSNGDTNSITSNSIPTLISLNNDSVVSLTVFPTVNTRYTATVWNKYGSASAFLDVIVTEPPLPTNIDIVSAHPWSIKSPYLRKCSLENSWDTISINDQGWLDEKNFFYSDYTEKTYRYGEVVLNTTFLITEDSLFWGNGPYHIDVLNDTLMIITHQIPSFVCSSGFVFTQSTYVPSVP